MRLDMGLYLEEIKDIDLTEAQKRELLSSLWTIVQSFVDSGFGMEATQAVLLMNQMNPSKKDKDSIGFKDITNKFPDKGGKRHDRLGLKP